MSIYCGYPTLKTEILFLPESTEGVAAGQTTAMDYENPADSTESDAEMVEKYGNELWIQEGFPNESSVYAAEGTFAHEVCEYKVRKYLHERVKRPQSEEFYTEEIDQITDVYAEFVVGVIEQMKRYGCEPLVLVEERVDYSHIAPSGFGTADMLIVGKDENGKGLLHIIDFKAGAGIFVDVDHNSQLSLYALGGLHAYGYIYPIEIIRMTIVQPRLENLSTFECSRKELEEWGESIKPIAKMAYEGKGEQKPGEWCRFCRAKPVCRACAEEAIQKGILPSFDYVAALYNLPSLRPHDTGRCTELTKKLYKQLDVMENEYSFRNIIRKHMKPGVHKVAVFIPHIDSIDEYKDVVSAVYPDALHCVAHSNMPPSQRAEAIDAFEQNAGMSFLYTVDLLNEGVHIDGVDTVIMFRKTQSPTIFLQQLGRALTANATDERITIFDFVANHVNVKTKHDGARHRVLPAFLQQMWRSNPGRMFFASAECSCAGSPA